MKFQLTESQKRQINKINTIEKYIKNVERSINQLKEAIEDRPPMLKRKNFDGFVPEDQIIKEFGEEVGNKIIDAAYEECSPITLHNYLKYGKDRACSTVTKFLDPMEKLYPKTYAAIPDDKIIVNFVSVVSILLLCGVDCSEAGAEPDVPDEEKFVPLSKEDIQKCKQVYNNAFNPEILNLTDASGRNIIVDFSNGAFDDDNAGEYYVTIYGRTSKNAFDSLSNVTFPIMSKACATQEIATKLLYHLKKTMYRLQMRPTSHNIHSFSSQNTGLGFIPLADDGIDGYIERPSTRYSHGKKRVTDSMS